MPPKGYKDGSTPETIAADKLCALSGLSDSRHRQLAAAGYFPPPIEGVYQFAATVQGIFRYYREHNQRTKEKLVNRKDEKTQKEIRLLDLEIARKERKTAVVADVDELHMHLATLIKTILYQRLSRELGPKVVGKSAAEINIHGRELARELCDIFTEGVKTWKENEGNETVAKSA